MNARFFAFSQALRSSKLWSQVARPAFRSRSGQLAPRARAKFSTSSILRAIQQASKQGAEALKETHRYPAELPIYDAGKVRLAFISFCKGNTIFLFGVAAAWMAPTLWTNPNDPDPTNRKLKAVGIVIMAAAPMLLLAYLSAPITGYITISLPASARQSRSHLAHFCANLPPSTRLSLTTLRIFPLRKTTTLTIGELRALPPSWWRVANLERVKSSAWLEMWANTPWYEKLWWTVKEPRWKFYVKPGRAYTVPTGVPGVWEDVAAAIMRQTEEVAKREARWVRAGAKVKAKGVLPAKAVPGKPAKMVAEAARERRERLAGLKRQTVRGE